MIAEEEMILESLSARRAWIEITKLGGLIFTLLASLSARRAWIEILLGWFAYGYAYSRSPQGERG